MSKSSHAQSFKGAGKGTSASGQALGRCGLPTKAQLDATLQHLVRAQPGWTLARCRQRARVEVYIQKGSAAR